MRQADKVSFTDSVDNVISTYQSVSQSVSQSICEWVSQSVSWLVSQSVSWSVSNWVSQSVSLSVGKSINPNQLINQLINQPINQSVSLSTRLSVSLSVYSCGVASWWCFIGLFCWCTLTAGGHPMLGIAASVYITVPVAEQFPAAQSQQFSVAFWCVLLYNVYVLIVFTVLHDLGILAHFNFFFHWTFGSVWWVLGLELRVVGEDCGWVVSTAGLWGILATWIWGQQLQPPGS